jgi:hypothetical protein
MCMRDRQRQTERQREKQRQIDRERNRDRDRDRERQRDGDRRTHVNVTPDATDLVELAGHSPLKKRDEARQHVPTVQA